MEQQPDQGQRLVELAAQKQVFLEQLLELSSRQSGATGKESLKELEEILDQKEEVILRVDRLDAQINVLLAGLNSASERACVDGTWPRWLAAKDQISCLLSRAKEIDVENRAKAKAIKDMAAGRLKTARDGKKGLALYNGNQVHIEGIFLDKKR